LTLRFFQEQIEANTAKRIRKITFCGNDGDPIYCRDLVEICQWLKTINPEIHLVIITNGSYKSESWWQNLGRTLDHRDEIHWSIDGWDQASNVQYRVNSDWNSIMSGMFAFTESNQNTYRIWATIAFRFNQTQLGKIQEMARSAGMDAWQMTKSTKFGSHYPDAYGTDDPLCPESADLVSSSHRFERVIEDFTYRARPGDVLKEVFWQRAQDLDRQKQYPGICFIGNKGVFLNSQGEFYPCCWTANRYPHNHEWHDLARSRFNLYQRKFSDIISDRFWSDDFLKFDSLECQTKCTQDKIKDREHTTTW
jgi:MoaA/NifB/PqqE/SkfB family radical SAM enzyme